MMFPPSTPEPLIQRRRQLFGLSYGIVAALAFSIMLWGMNGYESSQAHAFYPWINLAIGTPLAMLICGLAGWLTSRLEKPLFGVLFWMTASAVLAWLSVLVPMVFFPMVVKILNPQLGALLRYNLFDNAPDMVGVAFAWIVIGGFIIAAIQVPMLETATFSITFFGRTAPHIICGLIMLVNGSVVDSLNSQSLRGPLQGVDTTIQFILDHQGQQVDPKTARDLHVASFRTVQKLVVPERHLIVTSYDALMENVNVLVDFNGQWVECSTITNHPLNCSPVPNR
jgi:hypothetical protein